MRRHCALLVPLAVALAACGSQDPASGPAGESGIPAKGADRSHHGKPAPDTVFSDPEGGEVSLAVFEGRPVLVNLWATWCAPCVKELPTLDALAKRNSAGGALAVVAVSQDMGPQNSVRAFLETLEVTELGAYHDPKMALSGELGAEVLPTTILFDGDGREVWRYVGDLDWSGEDAGRLLAEVSRATAR